MGLLSSTEPKPDTDLMILNPTNYCQSKLDKSNRKYVSNKIKGMTRSFDNGNVFQISNLNGKLEVLKVTPRDSVPNKDTIIKFRNRIVYEEGYETFDIDEDRLVRVSEFNNLDDLKQVVNPKDFAKLIDNSSHLVEYSKEDNIYVLENYYHKLD